MKEMLLAIYRYRGFIFGSVKRDFQSRYQMSMLGISWLVLQPLSMIIVYTVIFSQLMQARLPQTSGSFSYSIYLCSGILTWGLFAEIISRSQNVFIDNANLLKKLNFPRICLPIIISISSLLNFIIIFTIFILFLILSGNFPGVVILAMVPLLILQIVFSIGLGMTVGVINVFFRDVGQFISILLQFWFWFTPIVYMVGTLPEWAQKLIRWNPMAGLINSYQNIFVHGQWPQVGPLKLVIVLSIVFCYLGFKLFKKHSADMVDEL
ncbi:TPA: ABC transporter permease [Yersinia enterocolitica]|nr:ABC transporter permease [Yersinia enterocolitica]HEN3571961.1 ABC transporter permease [Yersinia enterocolitica]HEN3576690.1 ABC transporter permease [Yersinia enterocolitica]